MPTDRGYVVLTEIPDGLYRVQVCQNVSADGRAVNVYAEHVGVPKVVTQVPGGLRGSGGSQFSTQPLEVFMDEESGNLYITAIHGQG